MRTNLTDREPITPGICEWCGKVCELEDAACSLSCEAQLVRLEAAQGRTVIRVLKRWRKNRGRKGTPGEGAMTEVATLVDRFLKTDRMRREEEGLKRRREAAQPPAKPGSAPRRSASSPKAIMPVQPVYQTAAPLTDQPDENNDAWLSGGTAS